MSACVSHCVARALVKDRYPLQLTRRVTALPIRLDQSRNAPYLLRFGLRQRLVRRFTVILWTLSALAMAASVNPFLNKTRTRESNPLSKPAALTPKCLTASTFRNGATSRRDAALANWKNRLRRASLLAFFLRSLFHPELACDCADVSPRRQGSPYRLL